MDPWLITKYNLSISMFKVHVAFSEYMNFKWSPTYSTIDFVLMVMLAVGSWHPDVLYIAQSNSTIYEQKCLQTFLIVLKGQTSICTWILLGKGRTNLIRQKMGGLYSSILSFTLLSHTRNYRVQRTRFVEFAQLHE